MKKLIIILLFCVGCSQILEPEIAKMIVTGKDGNIIECKENVTNVYLESNLGGPPWINFNCGATRHSLRIDGIKKLEILYK